MICITLRRVIFAPSQARGLQALSQRAQIRTDGNKGINSRVDAALWVICQPHVSEIFKVIEI